MLLNVLFRDLHELFRAGAALHAESDEIRLIRPS